MVACYYKKSDQTVNTKNLVYALVADQKVESILVALLGTNVFLIRFAITRRTQSITLLCAHIRRIKILLVRRPAV